MGSTVTHPKCWKSWVQRGNRTGHCAKCHETFEGIRVFDMHQRINEDGSVRCLPPTEVGFGSRDKDTWEPLRLVEGTWRGPAAPVGLWDNE